MTDSLEPDNKLYSTSDKPYVEARFCRGENLVPGYDPEATLIGPIDKLLEQKKGPTTLGCVEAMYSNDPMYIKKVTTTIETKE